jgi:hypothetical protein
MFRRLAAVAAPPRRTVYNPKAALNYDLWLGVSLTPLVAFGDDELLADAANGACLRCNSSTSKTDKHVILRRIV